MKSHPRDVQARILLHRKIAPDYYRLCLLCPEIARLARPGQFVMLRVGEARDPFLRRPLSCGRIFPPRKKKLRLEDQGALDIYYRVVGRGTFLMTRLQEGQSVALLGPLGNGFRNLEGPRRAILIGGGIGIAPLIAWADELRGRIKRENAGPKTLPRLSRVLILIGGRNRDHLLGAAVFRKMGWAIQLATEDGSRGYQGMVTDLLEREISAGGSLAISLFACGPQPMLVRVAQIAEQFDLPCQVLLESRMACGIGACLGCAVKIRVPETGATFSGELDQKGGTAQPCFSPLAAGTEADLQSIDFRPVIPVPSFRYARVCKEGPVFEAREILWE